jgi:uncharacterized protein YdaU (DUF1376 family)
MKYPWMPLFWGDFLANTMHLSAQEAGAYLFLIAHAWEHEGQIPGDRVRLARIAHVRHDRWKEVWKTLEPFFERNPVGPVITGPSDHGYHHERVTDELHRLGKIASNRKAAAEQMLSKRSASAEQNTPQMTPYPTSTSNRESSLDGKGSEAPSLQAHVNYRDPGVDYRSPPRTKSDNVLEPTHLVAAKRSTSEE